MSANDPAMLQFPGLLAAVVNDALADGVPAWHVVGALESLKLEIVQQELARDGGRDLTLGRAQTLLAATPESQGLMQRMQEAVG